MPRSVRLNLNLSGNGFIVKILFIARAKAVGHAVQVRGEVGGLVLRADCAARCSAGATLTMTTTEFQDAGTL